MTQESNEPSGASGGSARHAPGPWRTELYSGEGKYRWFDINDNEGACVVGDGVFGEGNARLIAAAPEMLAALQQIAAIQWGWSGDCGAVKIAENAIAKALGQ